MNIREMNIACIQLLASGEVKMRYWDEEVWRFIEALYQTPVFVLECKNLSTLFTRVQFALVSKSSSTGEENTLSPFFFLEDMQHFETEEGHVLVINGATSFTTSETIATAFKVLKEGTHGFDWEERKLPSSKVIAKKAEVLSTPKFWELKMEIDRLPEEKNALVRAQLYYKAGELRNKEKELWQQVEQMMVNACRNLVDE